MSLVPQLGMAELLLLGVLALIIVGPKDLPRLMHSVGKAVGGLRRMADDFRHSFSQMAKEAELEEMRKEIEALKADNPAQDIEAALSGTEEDVTRALDAAVKPQSPAKPPESGSA
ncbi:MAG: Sec-independent protein translocase protein TatB [Pseudomonadota bacterium]